MNMRKILVTLSLLAAQLSIAWAQLDETQMRIDSIEQSYTYVTGEVKLPNGVATIKIPKGFRYLDTDQAKQVLTDLWGNPPSDDMTLGFILRDEQTLLSDTGYVFNLEYDAIGYVKDDDAEDIDYADLMKDMKSDTEDENKERIKLGYDPIELVGWASTPSYDNEKKILYWAKEIKFGDNTVNTLNYNIRILGRKGVLVMNAIATMPNLPLVETDMPQVLNIVEFNDGYAYNDFNPDMDNVAAWSIGGLVAGKVLAKVGFFAMIVKFWKVIALAVAGAAGTFWKKFKGEA